MSLAVTWRVGIVFVDDEQGGRCRAWPCLAHLRALARERRWWHGGGSSGWVIDEVAPAAVTNRVVDDGTTVTAVVVGLWDGGGMERM